MPYCSDVRWKASTILSWPRSSRFVRWSSIRASTSDSMNADLPPHPHPHRQSNPKRNQNTEQRIPSTIQVAPDWPRQPPDQSAATCTSIQFKSLLIGPDRLLTNQERTCMPSKWLLIGPDRLRHLGRHALWWIRPTRRFRMPGTLAAPDWPATDAEQKKQTHRYWASPSEGSQ